MNHYVIYDMSFEDGCFVYGPFLEQDAAMLCQKLSKGLDQAGVVQYVAGVVETCYPFGLEEYGPFVGTYKED